MFSCCSSACACVRSCVSARVKAFSDCLAVDFQLITVIIKLLLISNIWQKVFIK